MYAYNLKKFLSSGQKTDRTMFAKELRIGGRHSNSSDPMSRWHAKMNERVKSSMILLM